MNQNVKKISYLSSLVLVVASTIGAGIFFKNRELANMSQGNMWLVLSTWAVAFVGIFALGMALIKLSSIRTSTKGILGWTKKFCPKWFHQATINYQKYFFIPITLFALSLYVVSTFVDAGWNLTNGWLVLLLSFFIFATFMLINLFSLKWAESLQWITTFCQMIPLFILPILALINFGQTGLQTPKINESTVQNGFLGLSPWLVLFGGLPAIFFAYDGFYTVAELKDDLKKPEKIGKSLCYGLIFISLIYLFLTIAFNLGSKDKTHNGINNLSPWLKATFNVLIAFGIMGIINGYSLASPRLYQTMLHNNESKDLTWLFNKLFPLNNQRKIPLAKQQFIASWVYLFITTTMFFIIFGTFGMLVPLGNWDQDIYGSGGKLYALADVMLNYSSLLIFVIIVTAIWGYLNQRKSYLKTKSYKPLKFFKLYSILAISLFYFSLGFVLLSASIDAFGFNNANVYQEVLKLTIFFGVIIFCIALAIWKIKREAIQTLKQDQALELDLSLLPNFDNEL